MIVIDQWNLPARGYEIQVMVINSRAIFVTVTSECREEKIICKTLTGTFANSAYPDQTPLKVASDQGLHLCLIHGK